MATESTTSLYPLDLTGSNSENFVDGERQAVNAPDREDYYFLIPKAAPFFVNSMKVIIDDTNEELVEGTDFAYGHYFIEAMESTGATIAGSIRLFDHSFNGIIRMEYQTLGDQWGFSDTALLEELSNKHYNPLVRSWGQIDTLPESFPPTPHDQRLDSLVGSSDLLTALEAITSAIVEANEGASESHLTNYDNPHRVSKAQVDLGNVDDFATATETQARDGISNAVFMTSLRTAQAIEEQAINPLTTHIDNTNNPHRVRKEDVELGKVDNFPTGSDEEMRNGSRNDRFATPRGVRLFVEDFFTDFDGATLAASLDDHKNNYANPHRTDAHDVGTYSSEELDDLFANVSATDTPRFAGMTAEEWRAELPSEEDITALSDGIRDEYRTAATTVGEVTVPADVENPDVSVNAMVGWDGAYGLVYSDDSFSVRPSDNGLPTDFEGTVREVSFREIEGVLSGHYIDAEGYIHTLGNAPLPPSSLQPSASTPPTPRPIQTFQTPSRTFALFDDDSMLWWSASDNAVPDYTGAEDVVWAYDEAGVVDYILLVDVDGAVSAEGSSEWIAAIDTIASELTDVNSIALSPENLFVVFGDGSVRGWTIAADSDPVLNEMTDLTSTLSDSYQKVTGCFTHFIFLTSSNRITYWTTDTAPTAWDVSSVTVGVDDVVAGPNYSVVNFGGLDVQYWGVNAQNQYLP